MTRPSIILVITDQQRYDTIGALGYPHVDTPHLDRLVREGVAFTNCHITGASCVPSRASLFQGYYPHTTGVLRNGVPWSRTWVERLAAAGYRCVSVGKMHTIPYDAPAGFHERHVVENKDRYLEHRYFFDDWDRALAAHGLRKQQRSEYRKRPDYRERLGAFYWELPEHLHSDFFVGDRAAWWVESYPRSAPLFLQVGFPGPHPPYDPIERYAAPYLDRSLPLPSVGADELEALPPAYKTLREHNVEVDHDSVVWSLDPSREQMHRLRAHYLANVTMIDEKIGALLAALDAKGYLDDAVVLFTSDHGDCMGDHGQIQKWTMYEQVTRVPLVAWSKDPALVAGGRTVDGLCQLFDLGPTVLDYAGVEVPDSFEATSLVDAIAGREWTARSYAFCEQEADTNLTGTRFETMVRSTTHKLVHFLGEPHGQLFDLDADPREAHDLWHEASAAPAREALLAVLREWRIESGYRTRHWATAHR